MNYEERIKGACEREPQTGRQGEVQEGDVRFVFSMLASSASTWLPRSR